MRRDVFPGRACLSVPGTEERRFAKGMVSGADEIILDLEDSVPAAGKAAARARVASWLAAAGDGEPRIAVRVNATRTPWCHADIEACVMAAGPLASIILPKVESAGDLAFADRLLDGLEAAAGRPERIGLQALIETPAGLADLRAITSASPRLAAVVLGYADLGASLGYAAHAELGDWLPIQVDLLTAARAAGVAAIDGPFLGVAVDDRFTASVRQAARLGFDGKWVIHPRQIAAVTAAFTPTGEQVAQARNLLEALRAGHDRGTGALALDGQMIDEAVAVAARRLVARAERVAR